MANSTHCLSEFLIRHRPALVERIATLGKTKTVRHDDLPFVNGVLDDFEALKPAIAGENVTLAERTFWFALYLYETLIEAPSENFTEPYERIMLSDLVALKPILDAGGDLPERFFATRPGESLTEWDDDDTGGSEFMDSDEETQRV